MNDSKKVEDFDISKTYYMITDNNKHDVAYYCTIIDTLVIQNSRTLEEILSILQWWKDSGLEMKYTIAAIDTLYCRDKKSIIKILDWWKDSGLEMKYTDNCIDNIYYTNYYYPSLDDTISREDINSILKWWKNNGLEIKYTFNIDLWYKLKYKPNPYIISAIVGAIGGFIGVGLNKYFM